MTRPFARPSRAPRGFVLSIAILVLALFMLIYAQLHSVHLTQLRGQEAQAWDHTRPLRLVLDAGMDLNTLLDERVFMDQNASSVDLFISARLPSALALRTNLLRYQSSLASWAQDANVYAFLDLNSMFADGNITGMLSSGVEWKRDFNGTRVQLEPGDNSPVRAYDINVYADQPYLSRSAWTLDANGNIYITLRYADQNTAHTFTSAGWITASDAPKTYTWNYGDSSLRLNAGRIEAANGSLLLDSNNTTDLHVLYTIHARMDQYAGELVRAGYGWPLHVVGADANVDTNTLWTTE